MNTNCSEQLGLRLAAFAVQAELGDHSEEKTYKLQDYLPQKVH